MDRYQQAEWLEFSGLPALLNGLKANAWLVFKKLVELDCRASREQGTVEIRVTELAQRCGLDTEKTQKILEALRKKGYLRCFVPDHPDEEGLYEIRSPIATPIAPEQVAEQCADPLLRDPAHYRYTREPEERSVDENKVQAVVDMYLNKISTRLNSLVIEEIEIAARRFHIERIRYQIDRASRHDVKSMSWVLRELVKDHNKKSKL